MPEKRQTSSSDCIASTGHGAIDLQAAGDFIERVKNLGATAIVLGDISVRFPDVMQARKRPEGMTPQQVQEWSA